MRSVDLARGATGARRTAGATPGQRDMSTSETTPNFRVVVGNSLVEGILESETVTLCARCTLAASLAAGPELSAALAAHFTFQRLPADRPLLFVGPPGAGKTLTTARLATRHVLGGAAPTIITADGKRAGAAEQLAAYTRLLSLTLILAPDAVTLARALARPRSPGPVLIDCPGTDPFHAPDREEIQAFAATAKAVVILVLPAGLCPDEAADLGQAYARAGATHLVATRLDLARRVGSILAAAHAARLALAEAGIGPGAADGLVPLTPELLATRLQADGTNP